MTTANTAGQATSQDQTTTPDRVPGKAPGRGAASAGANTAAEQAKAAAEAQARAKAEAEVAAKAKTEADAKAAIAAKEAAAAQARKDDLERLDRARKHLRKATPDDPIPLRRIETAAPVGDTLYGTPRNVIDLRNSEYAAVTLLFDGQVVHVINGKEPARSFWIGYSNIAAMYPRFDI